MAALDRLLQYAVTFGLPAALFLPWITRVFAAWMTLGLAWIGGMILLLKHTSRTGSLIASSLALSVFMVCLGMQVEPEPSLVGSIVGPKYPIENYYRGPEGQTGRFMVGESGTGFAFEQFDQFYKMLFEENGLDVKVVDGRTVVSSSVRDKEGNIIARITNNEWKIFDGASFDRNYSDDALEILDRRGDVIFQMYATENDIHLQGEWWRSDKPHRVGKDGFELRGIRMVGVPNKGAVFVNNPGNDAPKIRPIFRYPGDLHLGERVDDVSLFESIKLSVYCIRSDPIRLVQVWRRETRKRFSDCYNF